MIKCKIISMGSLKERYFKDSCAEYEKRLTAFCNLEICEITPIKISDNPSDSQIADVLEKEAELIVKKIPPNYHVVALCVEGKTFSSEDFAKEISKNLDMGKSICFIIGSSYGLSPKIKAMADLRLSLSAMTFPHKLFRVMLLEQIYRAFKINQGSQYHK